MIYEGHVQGGKITYSEFAKPKIISIAKDNIDYNDIIIKEMERVADKPKTIEVILFLLKQSPKLINIIWQLIKINKYIKRYKMAQPKDKKTTVSGIVKAGLAVLAIILNFTGIELPDGASEVLTAFIVSAWALFDLIQAYFTKDKGEEIE